MSDDHQHKSGDHTGHNHDDAPKNIALNPDAKGNLETTLRVAGMDCADEVEALEQVWMAILADTGATLLVIANALRLLRAPAV